MVSNESQGSPIEFVFFYDPQGQGTRPTGVTSTTVMTSSPSHMPVQQTPSVSLRGISSGYQTTVDYNACQMKSVFIPTSSPFDASSSIRSQTTTLIGDGGDAQNDPLLGGSIDSIDNKQVRELGLQILQSMESSECGLLFILQKPSQLNQSA